MRKKEMRNVVFINRLEQIRKKNGVGTMELACYCQVMKTTIESVEKGLHEPGLVLAYQIAEYFDMDVREIFDIKPKDSVKRGMRVTGSDT